MPGRVALAPDVALVRPRLSGVIPGIGAGVPGTGVIGAVPAGAPGTVSCAKA